MSATQHTIRCPHCEKEFEFLMLTATPEEAEGIKKMFDAMMQTAKANPAKPTPKEADTNGCEVIELLTCPDCKTPYIEPKNQLCVYEVPCSYCGRGHIKIDYKPERK